MACSSHTVNKCNSCNNCISDGIIRDGILYCSEPCYYKKHPSHHHSPIFPTPKVKPVVKPVVKYIRDDIKCNYCLETFDKNTVSGITHGAFWFCCQHHLTLANPRQKTVIMGPAMGPYVGLIRPVIGPVMGPVMGPYVVPAMGHVMRPVVGHVIRPGLYGGHLMGPFVSFS